MPIRALVITRKIPSAHFSKQTKMFPANKNSKKPSAKRTKGI